MNTIRTLARFSLAITAISLAAIACATVTGHFGPLLAIDILVNLVVILMALWLLNQPE